MDTSVPCTLFTGHQRPISEITYNYDGDLLFTASKDATAAVLWGKDSKGEDGSIRRFGERFGSFIGHRGAIMTVDPTFSSRMLLTSCMDSTCRIWNVKNGRALAEFQHHTPAEFQPTISIWNTPTDLPDLDEGIQEGSENSPNLYKTPLLNIPLEVNSREVIFSPLNDKLIVGDDEGYLTIFDTETGKEVVRAKPVHDEMITHIRYDRKKINFVTSSKDCTAKLFDVKYYLNGSDSNCRKVYTSERPVNDAQIHPTEDYVVLAGGQEAIKVTMVATEGGNFESQFYHKYHCKLVSTLSGHFSPVNCLALHPEGDIVATGGEDGYVRMNRAVLSTLKKTQTSF